MKLSAKTEYACIAMLELAICYDAGEPVRIRNIADAHDIPARFLVQILLQLKGAGLVNSTRGASGGYQLAKSPERISLGEVMGVIDGPDELPLATSSATATSKVLRRAWRDVAKVEHQALFALNFADLAQRAKGESEQMYYI